MASQKEIQSVILRNRAPRDGHEPREAVRESLLTDSTSGIVRGDEDTTSVDSFSSPDLDVSNKECLSKFTTGEVRKSVQYEEDFDGIKLVANNNTVEPGDRQKSTSRAFGAVEVGQIIEDQTLVTDDDKKVIIPDGGWGWVVVLSSFVISMIADGISFSFGLLYIEFLEEFKASKSTTAWIGSLFIAVPLLSGPVMSALVDRYGCRSMTILGGIISTVGFVLASISNTLEMMMITFGVIAGLGLGLVYVTAVVSIAYWFEKKRNLAVGLGACGTGVGTFVYAPMTQYFIEEFGWRGTILLLSGTLLNLCVCGCVMRDPEWWILEQKKHRKSKDDDKSNREDAKSKQSSSVSVANVCYDNETLTRGKNMKTLISKETTPEQVIKDEATDIRKREDLALSDKQKSNRHCESLVNLPTYLTYDDKASKKLLDTLVNDASNKNDLQIKVPSFTTRTSDVNVDENSPPIVRFTKDGLQRTHSEKFDHTKENMLENCQLKHPKLGQIRRSLSETKDNKPLLKQDSKESRRDWLKKQLSVNHHYLKDLKMPLNSISHRNAMLNIKRYKLKASSCPDIFKNSMITVNEQEEKWYAECALCLGAMFDVSLLTPPFLLLCCGTVVIFVWFIVPYFYLAELMTHRGYSEDDGAFVLSLIGIANTVGMVSLGWLGDRCARVSLLYAACLVLCGAAAAGVPRAAAGGPAPLAAVCAAFGLLFAASFTFTPSLLVTLVSLDDFTPAYGLVLLAQGVGHLIGPPLSGLIYDVTQSWEPAFYLAGGWLGAAGALVALIHPVQRYRQRDPGAA
ncbi:monocarboxylate transporter 14-like [Bicyclus anynana]|uniref:Monocarboxylate transporter 14-like n=1 Tax=Bicyclus anynana TaxID=110368 RepID=A0A6J1NFK6_BICAN|nr:monocarboxylate transporter 14-like [Bicyclus anynana]